MTQGGVRARRQSRSGAAMQDRQVETDSQQYEADMPNLKGDDEEQD